MSIYEGGKTGPGFLQAKTEDTNIFNSDELMVDIGKRLRDIRSKNHLTQRQMICKVLDDTAITMVEQWSRWEKGRRLIPLYVLLGLHKKFNIDLNWLLAGDDVATPPLPKEVQDAISILDKFKRDFLFGKKS